MRNPTRLTCPYLAIVEALGANENSSSRPQGSAPGAWWGEVEKAEDGEVREVFGCTRLLAAFWNSGFFFRKRGAEEQETMCGLRTGILYDVLSGGSRSSRAGFPKHCTPNRHASQLPAQLPELSISDSQVKAAFYKLLACPERLSRFKVCPFIDGPDELDEPAVSL
ncbi:hypothetical protein B0T18DRAFT_389646 [Schizothecium vesticola]|uniref:Uncharacterized protein n=1 Tax=Schizothecium vesticola TaxID=314040 RepID=A0AA40K8U6_9PEZI|nr:hypothetical protein B0T18DRAFT_389646 [Schizothecium vesticola]